jgi:transposase
MRKIKDILRLNGACRLSHRQIAGSCGVARSTVAEILRRAEAASLTWPLPDDLTDTELEARLYPMPAAPVSTVRPVPDWATVHQELIRPGVTLTLLWQEYQAAHPDGYQYSRFCDLYRAWLTTLDRCLRQEHRAGEKCFVDYAGQTVPVSDRHTGAVRSAQIFVAVLGASNYTYTEATWTQTLPDWIASHGRAFAFYGGVPQILVPDNLRSGVTKACRYEPELNPTYADLARHYGVAVIPARVRKPRDKAKVEAGVLLVERWILACLRNQTFFSLTDLNAAIATYRDRLNTRPFKKLPGCRRSVFDAVDRPALQPLPAEPYVYAEWRKARVNIDSHLEIEGHYYSVPAPLIHAQLDVRLTGTTLECFHKGQRVASHVRSAEQGRHTTVVAHLPQAYQRAREWPPSRLIQWADTVGPATAAVVAAILARRPHPEQGYRSCLGILRLGREYGPTRLEAACRRAHALEAWAFKSVQSILKTGLDQQPLPERGDTVPLPFEHAHVRGTTYYQEPGAKEVSRVTPSDHREVTHPETHRHGDRLGRATPAAGRGGTEFRGTPGPVGRPRTDHAGEPAARPAPRQGPTPPPG